MMYLWEEPQEIYIHQDPVVMIASNNVCISYIDTCLLVYDDFFLYLHNFKFEDF
jgi:hypothetical protein